MIKVKGQQIVVDKVGIIVFYLFYFLEVKCQEMVNIWNAISQIYLKFN